MIPVTATPLPTKSMVFCSLSSGNNKYNSYDETQPIITKFYDNTIPSLDYDIGRNNDPICKPIINKKI